MGNNGQAAPPPDPNAADAIRVMVPNADDPETGTVVRGTPVDEPAPEPVKRRRGTKKSGGRRGDPEITHGPVDVYLKVHGRYAYCGTFDSKPREAALREQFPDGGEFRFESKDAKSGAVDGREYKVIPGFAFRAGQESAGAGWAFPGRQLPPGYRHQSGAPGNAPAMAPPPPAAPSAPATDWVALAKALAPVAASAFGALGNMIEQRVSAAVAAKLPAPAAAPAAAGGMGGLHQLLETIGALEDLGLVRVANRDEGPDDAAGWAGVAQTVQSILESRGAAQPRPAGMPAPAAPPAAAPAPAGPVNVNGPPPASDAAARAEIEAAAAHLGYEVPQVVHHIQATAFGGRTDVGWVDLAMAGRALAAQAMAAQPAPAAH